ncbi:unnamed protein product [Callosobruchus maculatus]|uniref:Reticulon-like protein n=1 Tax=Callosobruchus maculatus TaxID=64391 RepID=A0A653BWL6_CALMS|nr:unnamed protein product [Callosobruchus maculatus]
MEDFHHELEPKAPQLQREGDSVDDFEHLGHDSSPLGAAKTPVGHLLDLQCEPAGKIDTATENTGSAFTGTSFHPSNIVDDLLPQKMDSNLLEMGDAAPQSAKQDEAEPKLQDFMHGESLLTRDFHDKYMIQSQIQAFMDNERQVIEDMKTLNAQNADYIDRYTDSDDDEFVRTKYENVPEKVKVDHAETFKDFDEPIKKEQPKPHVAPISAPSEAPPPVPSHAPAPAPVKEKTPEPVKEKTPEPAKQPPPVEPQSKEAPKKAEVKAKIAPADAEAIFKKMGLDAWFNPERLNPKVESLIYWRDPKKSGPVFGGVLAVLLSLTYFSLISVVAYLSLLALTGTIAFRIYKNVVQAVQKTGDGHPFKDYLDMDVSLPQDKVREIIEVAVAHFNAAVIELRRLFLVEDLVDSIKFGVLLWTLTYVGAWFNGMSLIIIAWVALFSLPKVYETNKTQIDANLDLVRTKLAEITSKVKAAIPIGKKAEEKKEQ